MAAKRSRHDPVLSQEIIEKQNEYEPRRKPILRLTQILVRTVSSIPTSGLFFLVCSAQYTVACSSCIKLLMLEYAESSRWTMLLVCEKKRIFSHEVVGSKGFDYGETSRFQELKIGMIEDGVLHIHVLDKVIRFLMNSE